MTSCVLHRSLRGSLVVVLLLAGLLQVQVRTQLHAPDMHSSVPHVAAGLTLAADDQAAAAHLLPSTPQGHRAAMPVLAAMQHGRLDVQPLEHPPRSG